MYEQLAKVLAKSTLTAEEFDVCKNFIPKNNENKLCY
jgi:hypothetical protein